MKPRTHYLIAKITAIQENLSPIERWLFCLGAAIPDYLPTQFFHRHFYQKSAAYVFQKIETYRNQSSLWSIFKLGELTHYTSDFCCSVHRSGTIGNAWIHLSYEHYMQIYLLSHFNMLFAENQTKALPLSFSAVLQSYFQQSEQNFHTDLSAAIQTSFAICRLRGSVSVPIKYIGGVPNGSCHTSI